MEQLKKLYVVKFKRGSQITMKKIILALFVVVVLSIGVFADSVTVSPDSNNVLGVYANLGGISFTYPLKNVDLSPYWKSVTTKDEMIGAQTTLAVYPNIDTSVNTYVVGKITIPKNYFKLSVGGITSFKCNGMPYGSIMFNPWSLKNTDGSTFLYIGFGYGHDFSVHQDHLLIGATHPIGDLLNLISSQLKLK